MALNKKRKLQAMRNGRFDKGITIKRLVARQGLECCYCHELCDWNDYEIKGQKQPCDKFPTIEHIIPIACGGTNTWDNVAVCCHKCNEERGTQELENFIAFKNSKKSYGIT